MRGFLKKLFGGGEAPPVVAAPAVAADMATAMAQAAGRFATRGSVKVAADAIAGVDAPLQSLAGAGADEELLSDAAAYVGEIVRLRHKGIWKEDPLLGVVLEEVGTVPLSRLVPLSLVERKIAEPAFSVSGFLGTLPQRLDEENQNLMYLQMPSHDQAWFQRAFRGKTGEDAITEVRKQIADFQHFWKDRFKEEITPSLVSLKQIDAFLRTHYHLFVLHEETLVGVGCLLGETIRGLHGGNWELGESGEPARAALVYPELPVYPIGKIYKMMTTRPAGDSLEEFARLIPSARKHLAGGQ